jgi:hypothetical protein
MTDQVFRPKLLLLGPGRHGKDTVAEMLREEFGLKFISSSLFAAERVMMPYFKSIGKHYDNVGDCFDDRHTGHNRAVWHEQIQGYNSPDKAKLAREILEESDIYVGMRCCIELKASAHLFDHIIWVDASGRGIPMEDSSSMTVVYDPGSMWKINNDGTLENLRKRVRTFGEQVLGFKHKERTYAT